MRVWLALLAALTLLTVGPGATAGTSGPPHNGLIAAVGAGGIYLVDSQTAAARKVPGTEELSAPVWSPDGSLLAVEGWSDYSHINVYTIKPDGTDRRLVLKNAWSPSWSPDGTRLVVVHGEDAGRLATVRADGTDLQSFTFANGNDSEVSEPVWSPDGKWIAYVGEEGWVQLVSPNGGVDGMRTIADSGWNLAWSPDGSKLAFDTLVKTKDRQETVVLDLATGKREVLPSLPNHPISALAWSPDGNQLAFLSARPMPESSSGHCGGEMPLDLWLMNADGSKPHLISKGSYSRPSWGTFQPAPKPSSQLGPKPSSQLQPKPSSQPQPKPSSGPVVIAGTPAASTATKAAVAPRTATAATPLAGRHGLIAARGRDTIYLVDPDSGKARKVPGTAKMAQPAWSPDGSLLAVAQAGSVYMIRPDGSHPQLVLRNASQPAWSPDGKRLFVERSACPAKGGCSDDDKALITVRPDGSDARAVNFEEEDAYAAGEPAWPPDGNWIGFYADEGANPAPFDSSAAAWSPDERQLAFVSRSSVAANPASRDQASSGLWVVAADGGRPHLLMTGIVGRPSWGAAGPGESARR